jgi:preprotein translocase subunit YajC
MFIFNLKLIRILMKKKRFFYFLSLLLIISFFIYIKINEKNQQIKNQIEKLRQIDKE